MQDRYVRLLLHCNNQVAFEEGYLLFKVGVSDESCEDHPGLCIDDGGGDEDEDSGAYMNGVGLVLALVVTSGVLSTLKVLE